MPDIISQMVSKAKEDNMQAARLLLERIVPQIELMKQLVKINSPVNADLSTQVQSIIQAVVDGISAPARGNELITSLGTLKRI